MVYISFILFFSFVSCDRQRLIWTIHPHQSEEMLKIMVSSSGMSRRSSIEELTYTEKLELCESEIISFVGSLYPPAFQLSESEEEDEFLSAGTHSSSPSGGTPDYETASAESVPNSPESVYSDDSLPESTMSEGSENRESPSDTSPPITEIERARDMAKLAKKLYPFRKLHEHGFTHVLFHLMEYVVQSVDIGSQLLFVKVLPCFLSESWSWFIVDGYVTDFYFTIQKNNINEPFRLTGVLEPAPRVDEMESDDLENIFLKSLVETVTRRTRRNICRLDHLSRLRLCSTAYAALDQLDTHELPRKWNFTEERYIHEKTDCVRDAVLHFDSVGKADERVNIPSYLLLCNVNSDLPESRFYLTLDAFDREVMYVVVSELHENTAFKYFLYHRLIGSLVLRMLRETALIERFFDYELPSLNRPPWSRSSKSALQRQKTSNSRPSLKKLLSSISCSSNESQK